MTSRVGSDVPLDVGRLRLLREVGLRGSIAGAARAMGLTPSAVSQQLALLERETATALVDRSPRGVALTGAGQALSDRAAEVLDLLGVARADLDRLAGSVSGSVTMAAVASAAATVVSTAVTELRASRPGIEVRVRSAEPGRGLGLLLADDVDLAVVDEYDYVPLALPEHAVVRELCTEPLVVVRPAGARRRGRLSLTDLADAAWVMPPEDAACGRAVRAACRTAGFEPRVRWETDDMLLLVRAVADGHGVAVLPRRSVAEDAAPVQVLPLAEPRLNRRLLAVARASVAERPVVAEVLDACERAAGPGIGHRTDTK
ncbi:LysR family transcriptional regulator [uncultured Jatrophihabitans sp.]|uniref:LysR family transcriptional regulator n=1 Tax=uncultured Jatrophihabitans sp. TaxID=1610747 RepID=UPI0035CBB921